LPPCPDYFIIFLATASIGAIWVGLNPKYSRHELMHPVADSEPTLVLARTLIDGRNYLSDLEAVCAQKGRDISIVAIDGEVDAERILSWKAFIEGGKSVSSSELTKRQAETVHTDPCLIVYTSGTTGKPKGATLTHHGLIYCSCTDAKYNLGLKAQRMLCNFPINHIACVGDVCCTTLIVGGTLVFMEQFDPKGILRTIERHGITHLGQIPVMLHATFSHPDVELFDLSSLQYITWGGNPASTDLVKRLRDYVPNLCNVYGMTETTGNVLFIRGDGFDDETFATCIGWPPEEYEVSLRDESGHPTKQGDVGEICVRGQFLMQGYWNNPEATEATFHDDGWMRTGDLASQRLDGAFCISGRRSEMYKSGGYNIYPAEIEQALETLVGIEMAVVIGVPDAVYSEVGHAFLICDTVEQDIGLIKDHCRSLLANYKIPKKFHLIEGFPLLPNGKVDKAALRIAAKKDAEVSFLVNCGN
ncbi:MAG: AMP-binding protein, partial [Kordiimonas sp.]